jgi:hypothetical protein
MPQLESKAAAVAAAMDLTKWIVSLGCALVLYS